MDPDHPVERFFSALPGWMFLAGALALLAMMLVTPPWLQGRDLAWQQQLMQVQLERLERQHERYQQFHEALASDDPVLLERLAFTHLRLTPSDKQLLDPAGLPRLTTSPPPGMGSDARLAPAVASAAIEAWLREPMPVVGVDVAPPRPVNTRLARLARGRSRAGLIIAAFACLLAALWSGTRSGAVAAGASPGRRPRQVR